MAYELSSDETYFLSQFLAKVESNNGLRAGACGRELGQAVA